MSPRRAAPVACVVLALAGCGVTRLQTARTVPRGETRTTVAAGVVCNNQKYLPDYSVDGVPIDIMVRHGATDQIDWGVRLFLGLGLLADVKWNLLPSESRTALALSAGLGGASDTGADSERRADVLHVNGEEMICGKAIEVAWVVDHGARIGVLE